MFLESWHLCTPTPLPCVFVMLLGSPWQALPVPLTLERLRAFSWTPSPSPSTPKAFSDSQLLVPLKSTSPTADRCMHPTYWASPLGCIVTIIKADASCGKTIVYGHPVSASQIRIHISSQPHLGKLMLCSSPSS